MIDLTTRYMGFTLKNPLVASASPLCENIDNLCLLEDCNAAAVVLPSLFEEQLKLHQNFLFQHLVEGSESYPEATSFFPTLTTYNTGPEGYLELIYKAKKRVNIPVIASLNGVSAGGWLNYAKQIEEAGADALELNIYYIPTDPSLSGYEVEQKYVEVVSAITKIVNIPVAVKIGSHFSSIPNIAYALEKAGATALVLFNRFYQPDIDIEELEVKPVLNFSNSHELLLRLNWVAILYGAIRCDLAVTGGVQTGRDVVKCMMAGARVAMTTSALLQFGIGHMKALVQDLQDWMELHEYESVHQMQGSMCRISIIDSSAFERANYMKVLSSYIPKQRRYREEQ